MDSATKFRRAEIELIKANLEKTSWCTTAKPQPNSNGGTHIAKRYVR